MLLRFNKSFELIDVTVQDAFYIETVLHWAAYNNALCRAEILLNNNANIFIKNNKNKTALDIAKLEISIEEESFFRDFIQSNTN